MFWLASRSSYRAQWIIWGVTHSFSCNWLPLVEVFLFLFLFFNQFLGRIFERYCWWGMAQRVPEMSIFLWFFSLGICKAQHFWSTTGAQPSDTFCCLASLLWRIFTWLLEYPQLSRRSLRPEKIAFLFYQDLKPLCTVRSSSSMSSIGFLTMNNTKKGVGVISMFCKWGCMS